MWGWKTITGSILLSLGEIFQNGPEPFPMIGSILRIVGPPIMGVGVVHKAQKIRASLLKS